MLYLQGFLKVLSFDYFKKLSLNISDFKKYIPRYHKILLFMHSMQGWQ